MTVLTSPTMSEACQSLIDARLDTIDRMLIGQVPRSDRTAIIGEIESQIHELLSGYDSDSITREDVLNVLRRLDPPEAYLTSNSEGENFVRLRQSLSGTAVKTDQKNVSRRPQSNSGRVGGIIGICSLVLVLVAPPVCWFGAIFLESELFLFSTLLLTAFLGLAGSVTGLIFSIRGRTQGVLPILGMFTSVIALLATLMCSGFVGLHFLMS